MITRGALAPAAAGALLLALAVSGAGVSDAGAASPRRVAFVADPAGVGLPIVQQAIAGLRRAARDFSVEVTVVVQPARTTWTSTFRALARQRYDLVIAPFSSQAGAVVAAAGAYPEQRFVVGDTRAAEWKVAWPPNVQRLSAREQEIGYVVGYLAGLIERRRQGPDVVGSVGGWNGGSVERFVAGFRAGARRASPSIRLLNGTSFNFGDPDVCRRIAEAQIAKGAGVVFNVAGACGFGTLDAARAHRIWGIGVDQDQAALGGHILTSAVKDVERMTYRTVEALVEGRLKTGVDVTMGIREEVLRLGQVSPRVPTELVARTREIQSAIATGRIQGIPAIATGTTVR